MLINFQNKIISIPWAYFHHYVDFSLYSKLPFGYRLSAIYSNMIHTFILILFGINKYIFGLFYIIFTIDYLAHEYNHTLKVKHYISYNIFSSKFIGIYYLMNLLEILNIIDVKFHKEIHHKEISNNMHLTADWLDFKIPIISHIIEYITSFEWKLFISSLKIHENLIRAEFTNLNKYYEIFIIKNILFPYILSYFHNNNKIFYNSPIIFFILIIPFFYNIIFDKFTKIVKDAN